MFQKRIAVRLNAAILIDVAGTPNEPQDEFAMPHLGRVENDPLFQEKFRAGPIHE